MDEKIISSEQDEGLRSRGHIFLTTLRERRTQANWFKGLRDHHAGTLFGRFAENQLERVQEDLGVLENLANRLGADGFKVKELPRSHGGKFSGLKLAPPGSPFSTFEALEFLSLGILGKRAIWRPLTSVATVRLQIGSRGLWVRDCSCKLLHCEKVSRSFG